MNILWSEPEKYMLSAIRGQEPEPSNPLTGGFNINCRMPAVIDGHGHAFRINLP